jgi:hypothetical protein
VDRAVRKGRVACESRESWGSRCEPVLAFDQSGGECRGQSPEGAGKSKRGRGFQAKPREPQEGSRKTGKPLNGMPGVLEPDGTTLPLQTLKDTETP